jgi:hypothetical protein
VLSDAAGGASTLIKGTRRGLVRVRRLRRTKGARNDGTQTMVVQSRGDVALDTVANLFVLQQLLVRLGNIPPDTPRRWGTLTSHEMLCHLGDAGEMVTRVRPRTRPVRRRPRRLVKLLWLWLPVRWLCGGGGAENERYADARRALIFPIVI